MWSRTTSLYILWPLTQGMSRFERKLVTRCGHGKDEQDLSFQLEATTRISKATIRAHQRQAPVGVEQP